MIAGYLDGPLVPTTIDVLLDGEVLCSVGHGNKKAAICSDFVVSTEPSDGLEPSTPSL